jgi:hypothetical protein
MPPITQVQIPGSNYQTGRAAKIDQITFHHIVGDAPAALTRFRDRSQIVSATYVIASDGTIYQCVAEKDTPYTDANFGSNSRAITIEHAGGTDAVPYTEAMYEASAALCASIRSRYNITRFKRHREVSDVPTACPGQLDVERIVNGSQSQEDDPMVTKEMEMSEAYKATGSYPGVNYSYPFVGTRDYNGMLSFWQSQMSLITPEMEKREAEGATGIANVIGKDYNSQFVGKPVVGYYPQMTAFWNAQPKAFAGDPNSETNILGKALLSVLNKLGYKKS